MLDPGFYPLQSGDRRIWKLGSNESRREQVGEAVATASGFALPVQSGARITYLQRNDSGVRSVPGPNG